MVVTIDVDPPVSVRARSLLSDKGYTNVHVTTGDGRLGWPPSVPYDRVVAWCSVGVVPQAWLDQSKPDAILLIPMRSGKQSWICKYRRSALSVGCQPVARELRLPPTLSVPMMTSMATTAARPNCLVLPIVCFVARTTRMCHGTSPWPGWFYLM